MAVSRRKLSNKPLKKTPTFDTGAVGLDASKTPQIDPQVKTDIELVQALQGYWNEADNNRKSGLNPRDDKWRDNLNLYWNRFDWSKKAQWQARETMPEVPSYVDRFAAAMKEALVATPEGFYSVVDPSDKEGDLAQSVKRMLDVWLSRTGRSQHGQLLPFSATFEEQIKLGALMAMCGVVTWKEDIPGGRVAIETVDPRFVWLDHTYRNLYRVRRIEVDRQDLRRMINEKDTRGDPLWRLDGMSALMRDMSAEMSGLTNSLTLYDQVYKTEMAGHGVTPLSQRGTVTLDEYIATVLDMQGNIIADRALMVVANQKHLVRGPEKNPFWHGQDWLVFTPLITTPLSVYGRTYMEDFASVAKTFTELTNLILDAVYTVSLKAWAVVPGMLLNPEQVAEGITPHKLFLLEEGAHAKDFAEALDLGTLPPESLKAWEMLKNELTEAADINEIGLGQFAPKGRTSATEVNAAQQSSSALIRSVAQTVETRWLDVVLDLAWKTGLQHVKPTDKLVMAAAGDQMAAALLGRKRELIERPYTFQARGISNTIARGNLLKSVFGIMQMVSSNPAMLQAFMQAVSIPKLVNKMFEWSGVDITQLTASEREQMVNQIAPPLLAQQQAAGGPQGQQQQGGPGKGSAGGNAQNQMKQVAQKMGVSNEQQ